MLYNKQITLYSYLNYYLAFIFVYSCFSKNSYKQKEGKISTLLNYVNISNVKTTDIHNSP